MRGESQRSTRSLIGPGFLSHERPSAEVELSDSSIVADLLPRLRRELTRSQHGDNIKGLDASSVAFADRILARKDI